MYCLSLSYWQTTFCSGHKPVSHRTQYQWGQKLQASRVWVCLIRAEQLRECHCVRDCSVSATDTLQLCCKYRNIRIISICASWMYNSNETLSQQQNANKCNGKYRIYKIRLYLSYSQVVNLKNSVYLHVNTRFCERVIHACIVTGYGTGIVGVCKIPCYCWCWYTLVVFMLSLRELSTARTEL